MSQILLLKRGNYKNLFEKIKKIGYSPFLISKLDEIKKGEISIDCAILDASQNIKTFFNFLVKKEVPVIIIIKNNDLNTALQFLKRGAYDFVPEPISEEALLIALERALERKRLIEERKRTDRLIDEYMKNVDKKVEELAKDLKESEQRYKELIENSGDGFFVMDMKGIIVYANESFSKIFGYSKGKIIGKNMLLLIHPEDVSKIKKIFRRDYKIPPIFEIKCIKKDKREIFIQFNMNRIKKGGNCVKIQGIARDVTLLKKKSEELEKLNHELFLRQEKLVALTHELEKKNFELARANNFKDIFLDIMRHDLLNPVGIILGITRIAMEEDSVEKIKEELEIIYRNAEKLRELIESASTLAKIESCSQLTFKTLDIMKILRKVIKQFEPLLKEKNMALVLTGKKTCYIEANPIIEEVFSNLISNAIKYSPEGGKIIVGVEEGKGEEKYENEVIIYVKDEGIGVPDEYKEGIFERFKRIKKEGVKGSGLGLAIVKRLVKLHNGRVWIEDNKPRGSIFYVELPKQRRKLKGLSSKINGKYKKADF